jgi:hypothetical protein
MNLRGFAFFRTGQRDEAGSSAMARTISGGTKLIEAQRC